MYKMHIGREQFNKHATDICCKGTKNNSAYSIHRHTQNGSFDWLQSRALCHVVTKCDALLMGNALITQIL